MSNKFREAFKVTIASYLSRSSEKDTFSNGKLCRTVSQRSYSCSVNSTSLNTCSSVCSVQPFNNSQQIPFRYFDSDMARKRPLVVSFRRIQKMAPKNLETCDSVSFCDIHRLKDNNESMTMKMMSKYGTNSWRIPIQKNKCCRGSQSCRSFTLNDKQKPQLDSLYDVDEVDKRYSEKGGVFPKEKFYGNAKLLLTMNDEILRTKIIDYEEDPLERNVDKLHNPHRNIILTHHLKKDFKRDKSIETFKMERDQKPQIPLPDDNNMIDEARQNHYGIERKRDFLSRLSIGKRAENETTQRAFWKMNKSSSAQNISNNIEEKTEAFERVQKSVSMLRISEQIIE